MARLISFIHNTSDHRQYCHVGNTAQHCRLGLFQDSDFAGDLKDSKSTSGGILSASSEVEHSFPRVGCVRNKLQSFTAHPNLKLFLWTLVCAWMVFSLSISGSWLLKYCILPKKPTSTGRLVARQSPNRNTPTPRRRNVSTEMMVELFNVDRVTTNAKPSHFGALLYIFEDDEAVIKMIRKKAEVRR